jgi:EmrB/QacA subfamily drug resistance transporter
MTEWLPPPPPPPTDIGWLVEPARPERVRRSPHGPWLVVATVCVGAFMGQLDASIVTLALPAIQRDFHAALGGVEWVSLSYLLALVVLVVPVGRVADMLGRKLLYVYGFAVFTAGSVACGVAPTLSLLIAFRVVQALGAALLQANSVALIATAVPAERLGRAIGLQGAAQAIGLAVGPAVGGALVSAGGWRWVFLVNAPIGVVGVVSGLTLLPRTRSFRPRTPFDWAGLSLFAVAVGATLFVLSYLRQEQRHPSVTIGLAVVAVLAAVAVVVRERRARHPMLAPSLFADPRFATGLLAGLLSYLVMFGALFATPFLLSARGTSFATAGLVLTALPAGIALAAPVGGRVADRRGARLPTALGMAVTAAALVGLAVALPHAVVLALLLAAVGLGLGAFTPANNAAIMSAAPAADAGVAGGLLNMTRGVGTSLGVAVTGLFLDTAGGVTRPTGYRQAMSVLIGCAVVAAVVAGVRGRSRAVD